MSEDRAHIIEWPTLLLMGLCYGGFALGTTVFSVTFLPIGIIVTALSLTLHSSLTHEVVHGHPFANRRLNAVLVFPAIGLFVPYLRFHDTHMSHHLDARLTDPYDDPESQYMDPARWASLLGWQRGLLKANNTLAGRMFLGPMIGQICFMAKDIEAIRSGDRRILFGWLLHIPALMLAGFWILTIAAMPLWAYFLSAYAALSLLKIRTYLEHQAHENHQGRTVIIEDNGLLAWLFLFNSLHVVHHMHPRVPWYRLPALFRKNRTRYLGRNHGYYFASYAQIFRQYLLRAKEPVAHPLWPKR